MDELIKKKRRFSVDWLSHRRIVYRQLSAHLLKVKTWTFFFKERLRGGTGGGVSLSLLLDITLRKGSTE